MRTFYLRKNPGRLSDASLYSWKAKYSSMGVSELRQIKKLEVGNRRLKKCTGTSRKEIDDCIHE